MAKQEDKTKEQDNKVAIAGRGIEIYVYNIIRKLQYFDQVEISCVSRYLTLAYEVIGLLSAVGIEPDTKDKKMHFVTTEEDLINRDTNEKYNQPVHRITLIKVPELFRFTQ